MHVRVKKKEIQEKLSKIQNIVEKKSIMPVLNHFLMDVTEFGAYILATDLETAVKQPLDVEIIQPGRVCIPARKFYEIVKVVDEDIEFSLIEHWIKIQSGRSVFRLTILDPSEFPVWPQIEDVKKINLTSELLLTAIEKTIYAAGEADAKYVLNAILFHIKAPEFNVVGTDGHRLAHFQAVLEDSPLVEGEKKVVLSKKSLSELRKFLSDTKNVSFYIGKTHVMFEMDGISFLTRMIEGNYPDYEAVIPRNNDKVAIVDKDLFIASLERVSILSKERQNAVRTEWNKDSVVMSSSDPEVGEAIDELSVSYQDELFIISFNAKYLIDALENINSDKTKITMSESEKAVYITDVKPSTYLYECVVMPLRL